MADQAAGYFKRALELRPNNRKLFDELAEATVRGDSRDEAYRLLLVHGGELYPNDPLIAISLVRYNGRKGDRAARRELVQSLCNRSEQVASQTFMDQSEVPVEVYEKLRQVCIDWDWEARVEQARKAMDENHLYEARRILEVLGRSDAPAPIKGAARQLLEELEGREVAK